MTEIEKFVARLDEVVGDDGDHSRQMFVRGYLWDVDYHYLEANLDNANAAYDKWLEGSR